MQAAIKRAVTMTQIRKARLKALQLKVWLFDVDAFQHAFMMVRASRWGRGCCIIVANAPNESWPKTARTVQHRDHSMSVASISVSSASAAAFGLFTNPPEPAGCVITKTL